MAKHTAHASTTPATPATPASTINVMVIETHHRDFGQKVVALPSTHPLVGLAQRWKEAGGTAYIDAGNDEPKLIQAWKSVLKLPAVPLPCQVDHAVFVLVC